jgi:Fe-S-cluster containining protein
MGSSRLAALATSPTRKAVARSNADQFPEALSDSLSLTDILCTQCGLCCDGSLFADVELASRHETSGLELLGLDIEDADDDEGALLLQPCGALKARRCSIYAHRPACCRTFECRLLQEVKTGAVPLDRAKEKIAEALNRIERVEKLLVHWPQGNERLPLKERCLEALALSEEFEDDQEIKRRRTELEIAMGSVENFIQKTFLG